MKLLVNEVYEEAFHSKHRYKILLGPRAAGRSTLSSQIAICSLMSEHYCRGAIMRNVLSDVSHSIYAECVDRLSELNYQEESHFQDLYESGQIDAKSLKIIKSKLFTNQIVLNKNEKSLFNTRNKNILIGKGFKKSSNRQTAKQKSLANYNKVFVEEAEEVSYNDFKDLDSSIRKAGVDNDFWLMLNPPSQNNWIIKNWFNLEDTEYPGYYRPILKDSVKGHTLYLTSTYHENYINLDPASIDLYESYKESDPDYYKRMIIGLVSEGAYGRIFTNWKPVSIQEFEELPYPSKYGLDFGFANDPTALIEVKTHNGKIWIREHIYKTGLTNPAIWRLFNELGLDNDNLTIADSAEPKSIAELQELGMNIVASDKGPDSVRAGISKLQSMQGHYTENSKNFTKELFEYHWALDKNGLTTNKPVDQYNHCWDAIRYSDSLKEIELPNNDRILDEDFGRIF